MNSKCGKIANKVNTNLGRNRRIMIKESQSICVVLCPVLDTMFLKHIQKLGYDHGLIRRLGKQ